LAAFNASTYTNQQLIAILQYHILPSIYTSERISPGPVASLLGPVASLLGPAVALGVGTGVIYANTVGLWRLDSIEIADIFAVDSVIQPLSAVLMPTGNALVPVAWPGISAQAAISEATGKAIPLVLGSAIMMFLLL